MGYFGPFQEMDGYDHTICVMKLRNIICCRNFILPNSLKFGFSEIVGFLPNRIMVQQVFLSIYNINLYLEPQCRFSCIICNIIIVIPYGHRETTALRACLLLYIRKYYDIRMLNILYC